MDSVPTDLFADASDLYVEHKRSRQRDSLFLMASIQFAGDAEPADVRVRNLSEGGLMVEMDRVPVIGEAVVMGLRGIGRVTGKIAWCTQGRIGVALDDLIDPRKARKPVGPVQVFHKPL